MDPILQWAPVVLTGTPDRWINLTNTLPIELLSRPPAPQEWSALECLQHLIGAELGVFPVRVQAILEGRDFSAFNPNADGSKGKPQKSPQELALEFSRIRKASLAVLSQVKPSDLDRTARHPELGQVTMSQLLHEWAGHDLMHTVQAERALMQPFILGCGPWQVFFKDHFVKV